MKQSLKQQSGFSLIEALVAFLVISVGMLGIASLQAIAMGSGHTAITRTNAVLLTQNILDRMRYNNSDLTLYAVADVDADVTDSDNNACNDQTDVADPQVVATDGTACTAAQLARDDLYHWKRSFPPNLNASITVTAPVSPRVMYTVTISMDWTEREVQGAAGVDTANDYTVTLEMI